MARMRVYICQHDFGKVLRQPTLVHMNVHGPWQTIRGNNKMKWYMVHECA